MANVPANRVQDIIKRMDENLTQPEAIKTCFGILAIMSRDDSNKLTIARDGMETILSAMTMHVDKSDVQESGCDLLWSLAFNNSAVKDFIAKFGGSTVLVRALKRHCRYADFLKSACGALSNMCQCKLNQEGVATQGGLQPLVGSIHAHHTNFKLLPFVFDALASLIVSNEENARTVSSLGLIPLIISSLGRHKTVLDVIKSGCHTLAILTDVKTQASKIALAGGVPVILSLLDAHPSYADLHRVAAVVLLRTLQESAHVAREITSNEGVRILLKSIERGGAQQDTVAAVTHILFSVTNPSSPASACIEPQLWISSGAGSGAAVGGKTSSDAKTMPPDFLVSLGGKQFARPTGSDASSASSGILSSSGVAGLASTALGGVVKMLGQYAERKDVVRAACRLLNNLGGYAGVVAALEKLNILDKLLECVSIHTETKDVIDSTALMLRSVHKICIPTVRSPKANCIKGLLLVFKHKIHDEEVVAACADALARKVEACCKGERSKDLEDWRSPQGKVWEYESIVWTIKAIEKLLGSESPDDDVQLNSVSGSGSNSSNAGVLKIRVKAAWSKNTPRALSSLLNLSEAVFWSLKLPNDPLMHGELHQILRAIIETIPTKHADILRRVEKLLGLLVKVNPIKQATAESASAGISSDPGESKGSDVGTASASSSSRMTLSTSMSRLQIQQGPNSIEKSSSKSKLSLEGGSESSSYVTTSGNMGNSSLMKGWRCPPHPGTRDRFEMIQSDKGRDRRDRDEPLSGIVIEGIDNSSSTSSICLYPRHPQKYFRRTGGNLEPPSLVSLWPNYLERLLPISPNRLISQSPSSFGSSEGERMHLSYEGGSAAGRGIPSRCLPTFPYEVPPDGIGPKFEHSLTFDSEFESGNLHRAVQRGDATYDLMLRSDMHTTGHTQWFYFAVSNTHPPALVRLAEQGVQVPPVRVRFNIVNLTKPDSLYNLGMRPVVYSSLDAVAEGIGWLRAGYDISYFANSYARNSNAGEGLACYYTLSFSIEFKHAKDTVLIAYSYPYTFTDYRQHIRSILDKPGSSDIIKQFKLCTTLGGESCDILVITDFSDKERVGSISVNHNEVLVNRDEQAAINGRRTSSVNEFRIKGGSKLKPALFLSGRVHPGETPASWMMKGILDFLISSSPAAQLLRQEFVVFVIPILNPDGIIFGNNRCSLSGVDLNRQWKVPVKSLHPTVYALKSFMLSQRRIRDIFMYIDLHGHSRKYNVFMYGCEDKKKPKPQARAFPKFFSIHEIGQKYVNFADCSFQVRKGRESTARVVVARELNIPCSFTLEATFCGLGYGPLKHCHMNIGHMLEVGAALCDAMLNFCISEGHVKETIPLIANARLTEKYCASSSATQSRKGIEPDNAAGRQGASSTMTAAALIGSSSSDFKQLSSKSMATDSVANSDTQYNSSTDGEDSGAADKDKDSRVSRKKTASGGEDDDDIDSGSGSDNGIGDGDGDGEELEEDGIEASIGGGSVIIDNDDIEESTMSSNAPKIPRRPHSNDDKMSSRSKSVRQNNLVAPQGTTVSSAATGLLPAFKSSQLPLSSPQSLLPAAPHKSFGGSGVVTVAALEAYRNLPPATSSSGGGGMMIRSLQSPRSLVHANGSQSEKGNVENAHYHTSGFLQSREEMAATNRMVDGIAAGDATRKSASDSVERVLKTTASAGGKKKKIKTGSVSSKKKAGKQRAAAATADTDDGILQDESDGEAEAEADLECEAEAEGDSPFALEADSVGRVRASSSSGGDRASSRPRIGSGSSVASGSTLTPKIGGGRLGSGHSDGGGLLDEYRERTAQSRTNSFSRDISVSDKSPRQQKSDTFDSLPLVHKSKR